MLNLEGVVKNHHHQVGEDIGGSIEVYDPGLNQWRMQGTMQDARYLVCIVYFHMVCIVYFHMVCIVYIYMVCRMQGSARNKLPLILKIGG